MHLHSPNFSSKCFTQCRSKTYRYTFSPESAVGIVKSREKGHIWVIHKFLWTCTKFSEKGAILYKCLTLKFSKTHDGHLYARMSFTYDT